MKRRITVVAIVALVVLLAFGTILQAQNTGVAAPKLYVIIEAVWESGGCSRATWYMWGPQWEPEIGGVILQVRECYEQVPDEFIFVGGRTVRFKYSDPWESCIPVPKLVVLHDIDGDGTYTGSLRHWITDPRESRWFVSDIDFELTFDGDHNLIRYYYCHYDYMGVRD
jgi:hypothetical protein